MEQKKKENIGTLFSRKDLKKLIVPLVIEQTLAVMVGMADTILRKPWRSLRRSSPEIIR